MASPTSGAAKRVRRTVAHGHSLENHSFQNHCFACGPANPEGMRLKFYFNEAEGSAFCRFKLSARFQGPPGHTHGGIIATILDEAMSKVNKLKQVVALTSKMQVEYLKPVPMGVPLKVIGKAHSIRGRRHTNVAEIHNANSEVLARGLGVFIAVNPERMFAKQLWNVKTWRGDAEEIVTK